MVYWKQQTFTSMISAQICRDLSELAELAELAELTELSKMPFLPEDQQVSLASSSGPFFVVSVCCHIFLEVSRNNLLQLTNLCSFLSTPGRT